MVARGTLYSLLASALVSCVAAAENPAPDAAPVLPGAFIVEFEDGQDESIFYSEMSTNSLDAAPRMSLDYKLFKGASFRVQNTASEEETKAQIQALSSVKNLWPVRIYSVPKDEVVWTGSQSLDAIPAGVSKRQEAEADTFSPHVMTQVDRLRAEGVTGAGLKVAVIDTGIDYLHPALGGGFGPGFLVSYGTDLVGDNYTGANTPVPDDDPIDECEGHGTHVAGIVAAQENPYGFTGTAPGVTLGAYRVFGCGGSAGNDVLIAAYNQAFEDGSDIITASIGGASGWSEDPWAVAVQRIVEQGVPCTVSAGNDGATGQFYASTAANGKRVTAIASVDNTESPTILVAGNWTSSSGSDESFGWSSGSPATWGNVTLPLWAVNYNTSDTANGCTAYPDDTPDLSGNIVLIRRGSCTFQIKAENAVAKGAQYVLIYNNAPGASAVSVVVPGLKGIGMVTADQGVEWINLLAAGGTVTVDITDPTSAGQIFASSPNTLSGGFLSTFTSWGPTFEVDVKPQFSAPGGQILSTYPRALGAYAVLSGTSMACPQAAGVVALIGEVRGTLDPAVIENILASTANAQLFNDGRTTSAVLAPVTQQGAGMIQAYDAAHATALLSASSLSFNDTDNFSGPQEFTIKNVGTEAATYELGHVGAATAYTLVEGTIFPATFPNEFSSSVASVKFSESSITIPAGEEATIQVDLSPPTGLDATRLPVYSGYITLNSTDADSLSLPYLGVAGSLNNATVLEVGYLTASTDTNATAVAANSTFTVPTTNATDPTATYPATVISLALGSRLVRLDVVPQSPYTNASEILGVKSLGNIFGYPIVYQPRAAFIQPWTGQLEDGSFAPAGAYKLLVRALRIFGDETDADQYDVAETVSFNLKYSS